MDCRKKWRVKLFNSSVLWNIGNEKRPSNLPSQPGVPELQSVMSLMPTWGPKAPELCTADRRIIQKRALSMLLGTGDVGIQSLREVLTDRTTPGNLI
jgi:hypothetical protein